MVEGKIRPKRVKNMEGENGQMIKTKNNVDEQGKNNEIHRN